MKDGGPAFPQGESALTYTSTGMSLRDYFAAKVLPQVYASSVLAGSPLQESIAQEAYEIADAMLAERERAK